MYSIGYYLKPKTIAIAEHRQQPKGIAKEGLLSVIVDFSS
jgi:hypothetical protein